MCSPLTIHNVNTKVILHRLSTGRHSRSNSRDKTDRGIPFAHVISSVKSFLVPKGSRFTSSTTPLLFVSVWRSYLGMQPSPGFAFCESPGVTHTSRNKGMQKSALMALRGRIVISRPSSTAPPRCSRKTQCGGRGASLSAPWPRERWASVLGHRFVPIHMRFAAPVVDLCA
jgi:hypothetical protein